MLFSVVLPTFLRSIAAEPLLTSKIPLKVPPETVPEPPFTIARPLYPLALPPLIVAVPPLYTQM